MKHKIVIVAIVLWFLSVVGGGLWGRLEQYWRMRSVSPGQLEVQNLTALYNAKLFDEVLAECERANSDVRYADCEPQIMYVRWATDRRIGKTADADIVQQKFLQQFPSHILAADMHFSTAMNDLASADYGGAETELALIRTRFAGASIAPKAGDILTKLQQPGLSTRPSGK